MVTAYLMVRMLIILDQKHVRVEIQMDLLMLMVMGLTTMQTIQTEMGFQMARMLIIPDKKHVKVGILKDSLIPMVMGLMIML